MTICEQRDQDISARWSGMKAPLVLALTAAGPPVELDERIVTQKQITMNK
jgi:hypothetical protein